LDSTSQSHFITVRCARSLRLSRIKTHACIQGISNINTAAPHGVSIHFRSKHSDWLTTLDYVVSPNTKGTTPFTKLDTSSWKIPDIKLAESNLTNQVSLIYYLVLVYFIYSIRQANTPRQISSVTRNSSRLDTLWSNPSCHRSN
jgi:hypothetical protein